uniref:Cyclin_C domain-containing protein n=1 Tax=Macrostomum lignano TaxID=282301 RepID=A0A1I8FGN6_9PLAT
RSANASIFHAYFRPGNYTVLLAFRRFYCFQQFDSFRWVCTERRLATQLYSAAIMYISKPEFTDLTVSLLSVVASKKSVLTSTSDLVNVIEMQLNSYSHTAADLVRLEGFIQPAGATTAAHWLVSTYHVSGDREHSRPRQQPGVRNATCRVRLLANCMSALEIFNRAKLDKPHGDSATRPFQRRVANWSIVLDGVVAVFACN